MIEIRSQRNLSNCYNKMALILRNSTLLITIIAGIIACVFSVFTIFLIQSSVKYLLFGFEVSVILVTFLIASGYEINIPLRNSLLSKLRGAPVDGRFINALFIVLSVLLVIFSVFNINAGFLQILLAVVCGSFLVGYSVLDIFRFNIDFSRIEIAVISFLISIGFSGLCFLVVSALSQQVISVPLVNDSNDPRGLILSSIFLVIGAISFIRRSTIDRSSRRALRPHSIANKIDILAILICVAFYLSYNILVYPNAALLIGTDISRHFTDSTVLIRSPELYSAQSYVLFHAFQASVLVLSKLGQDTFTLLSSMAFLNIFLPLSVYAAAKRTLGGLDRRIPSISVMFYTLLSNFSFIYFTRLNLVRPENTGSNYLLIAREVAEKSYFGIINFLQPFHYVVPLTISVVAIMALLSVVNNRSISRIKFIAIFGSIVMIVCLVHIPEAIAFVIFIAFYSFIWRRRHSELRIKAALVSSLVGFIAAMTIFFTISHFLLKDNIATLNAITYAIFVVPSVLVALTTVLITTRKKNTMRNGIRNKCLHTSRRNEIATIILISIYLIGLILWFFVEDFKTSPLIDIGIVPSFVYPAVLGIAGLLSILSVREIQDSPQGNLVLFLLLGIAFMLVMGKVVSLINVNLYIMPYWEKRFPIIIFAFATLLAPLPLIRFRDYVASRKKPVVSTVIFSVLVSAVILAGYSSLATQIEYWLVKAWGQKRIDKAEAEAISFLRGVINSDPKAITISPTEESKHVITFATPYYQLSKPGAFFTAEYPEIPLLMLGGKESSNVYIYIHDRDSKVLDENPRSWFSRHLMKSLQVVFSNSEVTIYNASSFSYPQAASDTALLIPQEPTSNGWVFGYDLLSQSGRNYTVIYDNDPVALKQKNLILVEDPLPKISINTNFSNQSDSSQAFWQNSYGRWKYTKDGLHAYGNPRDTLSNRNIFLSPILTQNNMNITSTFRINDADENGIFSYISFITAWSNRNNFEFVGLATRKDDLYAYFAVMKEGKLSFFPKYPFLKTALKWHDGSAVDMTLSIKGSSQDLFINGTHYLHNDHLSAGGVVGLSTSRSVDVAFQRFEANTIKDLPISESQYIEYVNNGGNLLLLNSNGHGPLLDQIMNNSTIHIDSIKWLRSTRLNSNNNDNVKGNIDENYLTKTDDILRPIANSIKQNYSNGKVVDPSLSQIKDYLPTAQFRKVLASSNGDVLIINATCGKGHIVYINIYPILLDDSINERSIFLKLGELSRLLQLSRIDRVHEINFRDIPAIFKNINGKGAIQINSDSAIFPDGVQFGSFRSDSNVLNYENISNFKILGNSSLIIHTDNIRVLPGKGSYSLLVFRGNITITNTPVSPDRNLSVFLQYQDKNIKRNIVKSDIKSIVLQGSDPYVIYTRHPKLDIDGRSSLKNLDAARLLYTSTGNSGGTLTTDGKLSFRIMFSDRVSLLSILSMQGHSQSSLQKYNEFSSFASNKYAFNIYSFPIIVRVVLAIPFLLASILIFYKKIF
jgi:hypothetical protein